ncbi:hypothetical protein [Brachybacterium sacelli]|uniref:Membrane protein SirB2 n=1 Tax=Brachybacterium sacelli TaxID=173364 RepID=A0ABS4X1A3_9MICO|nr:hypothetical protein [Brachybacterium sacelli]MBP2382013.1 putative membrane protein SirB2 [Brachybacterium sacelli]
MSFVISLLVVLHLLCWAISLGLWVAAIRTKQPQKGMAHAAGGALVLGIIMMGLSMAMGTDSHLWFTLKLVIALVVTAFSFVAINRREETPAVIWYGIPTAIVLNVIIAVFGIGR